MALATLKPSSPSCPGSHSPSFQRLPCSIVIKEIYSPWYLLANERRQTMSQLVQVPWNQADLVATSTWSLDRPGLCATQRPTLPEINRAGELVGPVDRACYGWRPARPTEGPCGTWGLGTSVAWPLESLFSRYAMTVAGKDSRDRGTARRLVPRAPWCLDASIPWQLEKWVDAVSSSQGLDAS